MAASAIEAETERKNGLGLASIGAHCNKGIVTLYEVSQDHYLLMHLGCNFSLCVCLYVCVFNGRSLSQQSFIATFILQKSRFSAFMSGIWPNNRFRNIIMTGSSLDDWNSQLWTLNRDRHFRRLDILSPYYWCLTTTPLTYCSQLQIFFYTVGVTLKKILFRQSVELNTEKATMIPSFLSCKSLCWSEKTLVSCLTHLITALSPP